MKNSADIFSLLSGKQKRNIDLRSILGSYIYHWPLYLICLAATIAGAYFYLQNSVPKYEIKASVIIKDQKKERPNQASALEEINLSGSRQVIENEMEILKSKKLLNMVVNDLSLWLNYGVKEQFSYRDLYKGSPVRFVPIQLNAGQEPSELNLVLQSDRHFSLLLDNGKTQNLQFNTPYRNHLGVWKLEATPQLAGYKGKKVLISVTDPELSAVGYQKYFEIGLTNKAATTVELTAEDEVPERGKDILNRIIYNYNLLNKLDKNREIETTVDFIDQRLSSLGRELSAAEKNVEDYRRSQGITDITTDSKITLENLQNNDSQLNKVNVQLSVIEGIERYLQSGNTSKAPSTLSIEDPALVTSVEKLAELLLKRDELLATLPENNPAFGSVDRQIASTRAAIKENVRTIKLSLIQTRNKLQSYNANFENSIRNIPRQERQYIGFKRQQAIKENLYTYLLQKREEVSVSYASALLNDRVVDHAYITGPPASKKGLTLLLALFAGIAIPSSLIFARRSFSNSITDLQEVKEMLDAPVICELPIDTAASSSNKGPVVSEPFRMLRTKLNLQVPTQDGGRVILITSSIPGEGKSFVSRNLGIALAASGKKTILLELDLRKPGLAKTFGLPNGHAGITNYLLGQVLIKDIIQQSGVYENLHVMSSGLDADYPAELLEGQKLRELITGLREFYDHIVIDSPPVHLVSDALIIEKQADLTLYLIRQGFTSQAEIDYIDELYNQKQLRNMHLIFNGINKSRYGYGYQYPHSYYNKKGNGIFTFMRDLPNRF